MRSGLVATLVVVVVLLIAGYGALDQVGWIAHNVETTISAEPSWFVGESKGCTSYPLHWEAARALYKGDGYALDTIVCDNGPYHHVKIRFYGRVYQPEYTAVTWKCTREQNGFTCYEMSGFR